MSDNPNTNTGGGDDRLARRVADLTTTVESLTRTQHDSQMQVRIQQHGQNLANDLAAKETAIGTSEGSLAQAHENGDAAAIASAQRQLSEAISQRDDARRKLDDHKGAVREYEAKKAAPPPAAEKQPETTPEKKVDYSNLNKWKAAHKDWYGVDEEMTTAAHEIDQNLRKVGVITIGSDSYFEAVDSEMAKRYPNKFRTMPSTAGKGGGSVTNTNSGGRIPQNVVENWARMGINTDDPKVMERMVQHRERLVDKGILPEKPVYERIRT